MNLVQLNNLLTGAFIQNKTQSGGALGAVQGYIPNTPGTIVGLKRGLRDPYIPGFTSGNRFRRRTSEKRNMRAN